MGSLYRTQRRLALAKRVALNRSRDGYGTSTDNNGSVRYTSGIPQAILQLADGRYGVVELRGVIDSGDQAWYDRELFAVKQLDPSLVMIVSRRIDADFVVKFKHDKEQGFNHVWRQWFSR